jgi:S-DNA-T family DNA segregation ATPase FtsK/SpoIIIE
VHRPVRAHPRPPPATPLTVAAPPTVGWASAPFAAWLQYLVPLAGSGGSIAFLFAVPGPRPAWLVALVIGAAVASVAAGLALRLVERRGARRARRRYLAHLAGTARRADHLAAAQLAVADHLHPDLPALRAVVEQTDRLWERRPTDTDFLTVRIGRGPVPLGAPARLDPRLDPLAEHDPELLLAAEELVRRATWLPGAPVPVSLREVGVLALTGPPVRTRALARAIVCELATFHAPDDLRILVAHPSAARRAWRWTEWLPHTRDPAAATPASGRQPSLLLAETSAQLHTLLGRVRGGPHVVAIVDTAGPIGQDPTGPPGQDPTGPPGHDPTGPPGHDPPAVPGSSPPAGWTAHGPALDALLDDPAAAGATVIWLARTIAGEPSELSMRVRLDDRGSAVLQETAPGGRLVTGIRPDAAGLSWCESLARRMAPLRLDRRPAAAAAAGPVRLLDLLDRPDPGAATVRSGRRPRDRSELLQVPIGVTPDGSPLVLDLKEAAEAGIGPHGLVIGATGSGKSELLRTIVAGLAATHPPDQLAFVLVDFKGGAAFADLAPLPQVAGLITNLQADLSMADRAMAALQGELARRQRVLHEAGNQPDLRAYAARRAADPWLAPLPHLLVVVDEFGELLAARPEFLDLFTAVGRVGRSLGMHLLLASQRLDEGRLRGLDSHLRFRICLRTFSAAESTAVLGVPDAYHLPAAPGSALLKADAGPPVRFAAARISSGPPHPPGKGQAGAGLPPAAAPGSDLEVLLGGLAGAGPPAHQVWLPPLAPEIALEPLLEPAGDWLQVPVGVVDRPVDQAQGRLVLDLSKGAGHLAVVGAPRSGKSTLLCTLVAALTATHQPDEVQLYAVDAGGGLLHRLRDLPHVGAVCGPRERERVRRLVRELRSLLVEREHQFRELAVDSMAGWHARRRGGAGLGGHGEVLLLIDNWGAVVRELPELEPEITELAALGLHYGVHVVLTANRWAEVRPGLRENLGGRLELRLNDPLESEVGRTAAAGLPDLPGRGLTQSGLQFQTALPGPPDAVLGRARSAPGGGVAPPLRLLPALVEETALTSAGDTSGGLASGLGESVPAPREGSRAGAGGPAGLPFAVEEHRLEVVGLDLFGGSPHLLVFGDAGCGKSSLLRLIARGMAARSPATAVEIVVVDPRRGLADLRSLPNLAGYASTTTAVAEAVDRLRYRLEQRMATNGDPAPEPVMAAWTGAGPGRPIHPVSNGHHPPTTPEGPFHLGVPEPRPGAPQPLGPRLLLLVDDYDLLPAAGGSPLLPLLDLFGLGRELGLHVVLARRVAGAARAGFEPVVQRLRELGGAGVVMRGDPGEGPIVGGQRAAVLPPGRGLYVCPPHGTTLVQVAYCPPAAAGRAASAGGGQIRRPGP